ncbi:thioredoxin family protein [Roseinatronobacter sp. NSM]|uniref:thioredoxin family protein n=1 Tax=Roseinatronobacter sp. NSM TaxID=3457785 RepID=UPI004036E206
MAVSPPVCDFGWQAPGFTLPATDGRSYTLNDIMGPKGALVMFICNHCPYVLGVVDRIVRDARDLQAMGVGVAAICANDAQAYPADSFANMARFAREHDFPFPYLHDESQNVARAWGAQCTPDFFGLNAAGELHYRGRLDGSGRNPAPDGARRDLYEAMAQIAQTGAGPRDQIASMGCSIKWKPA